MAPINYVGRLMVGGGPVGGEVGLSPTRGVRSPLRDRGRGRNVPNPLHWPPKQSLRAGCRLQGLPPKSAPYTVFEPLHWDSNSSHTQNPLPLKGNASWCRNSMDFGTLAKVPHFPELQPCQLERNRVSLDRYWCGHTTFHQGQPVEVLCAPPV